MEALRLAGLASLASVALSVLLTLAILAGINGSLDAGRNRTVRQLRTQVEAATTAVEAIAADLTSIDGRLQALEGLSGRMSAVEDRVDGMRADLDEALTQVGAMQAALADVQTGVQELGARVDRFDEFLDGLRALLGQAPEAPVPEAGPAP
jgi:chromosome segregation ATPase